MKGFWERLYRGIDHSALMTVVGVILMFSAAIVVTLIAPSYMDPSWTQVSCAYQKQMYEVADPNIYISNSATGADDIQLVYHIQKGKTLLAFTETDSVRVVAPPELERFVTPMGESQLRLTSELLLLREPAEGVKQGSWDGLSTSLSRREQLQRQWKQENPNWEQEGKVRPYFQVLELYRPEESEQAFARVESDGVTENWVDTSFVILDEELQQSYHQDPGVLYVNNPMEYRISYFRFGAQEGYQYDPRGEGISSVDQLRKKELGFLSRKELIELGEDIYAAEGCWYCHTDQSRTLVQDSVLNGSEAFPAPPSAANEYVFQRVTFPGTRRIGPDISRVGVKRPSRDWHKAHFWSPKTASAGTIMPRFQHFFDYDPRGTAKSGVGVPNYKFEAVFQYLMTKGTRITPPTQAWWQGKDPIGTIDIIEGREPKKAVKS